MDANKAMSTASALRYFGIADIEELERIIVEYDIDCELVDGNVIEIDGTDLREALFEEHRRGVGHRPDDPGEMGKVRREAEEREQRERAARQQARRTLVERVKGRP